MRTKKRINRWICSLGFVMALSGMVPLIGGCPLTPPSVDGCTSDADCDDGIACTVDACTAGVCVNDPVSCQPIDVSTAPEEVVAALDVQSEITAITIDSPPVVEFTATTAGGSPITGIGALWAADNRFVRFTLTKLVPGTNGDPSIRVSYTRETTNDGSSPPNYDTGSSLVDYGDGSYKFTFNTDVANVTGVTYEPTRTHRVAGQIGSGDVPLEAQNLFLDFVPVGGALTETRNIEVVDSCNECHGRLVIHGRRFITEYCVNCHNPDLAEGEGDMKYMIHKIHSAQKFDVLDDGVDYSDVTYPQDIRNCRKCHNGEDDATPDGDNWKNVPNKVACGSCHPDVNFDTGENHVGGAQANNSACATCHPASGGLAGIEDVHLTNNATPNNQSVPAGAVNFTYDIPEVRVNAGNEPVVTFRILADDTALDLSTYPPTGFTGGPSFVVAYAGAQDGIDSPTDYNNAGRSAGQPASVSIANLVNGTQGTLTGPDADGYYIATLTAAPFPAGATLRAVALQAYFTQVEPAVARHTISVVKNVTGDALRRIVIDPAKCGNCHEWLELHGGSRVIAAASDPTQPALCVMCHNPNLSSSGRTVNPDEPLQEATVAAVGEDPLIYPERSMQLKNLVHGIHAADRRTEDYEFVRNFRNGIYFDFSEVTFPGVLNNCLTCHFEGTYELPLPDGVLMSTERTTTDDPAEDKDAILGVRDTVPNSTDLVNTPTTSTCYQCHDSELAVAHMEQNGGQINVLLREELVVGADFVGVGADALTRDEVLASGTTESCVICHGAGRIADLKVVHGIE